MVILPEKRKGFLFRRRAGGKRPGLLPVYRDCGPVLLNPFAVPNQVSCERVAFENNPFIFKQLLEGEVQR